VLLVLALCTLAVSVPEPARGQANKGPAGELRWGLHVTLAARWLDPAETEAFSTPFMVMYALHDAMLKPMPAGLTRRAWPSRGRVEGPPHVTFVLRKGVSFHNGDPVTAEDVKFSWDRYKGASAKLLHDKVKESRSSIPARCASCCRSRGRTSSPSTAHRLRRRLDRAQEVRREGRRGRLQDGASRRRPVQGRLVQAGMELVLEAFEGYWRKAPSIKRLVMRSMPEEATRAAALRAGEVDIAFLLSGTHRRFGAQDRPASGWPRRS
jgi:peptide/nickel transport system substrate-binding protein